MGEQSATEPDKTDRKRLVVELSRDVSPRLDELVEREDMNKTTIVNRALQLYHLIAEIQREGGRVFIQEAGEKDIQRLRLI